MFSAAAWSWAPCGGHGRVAGLDHRFEGLPLVGGVPLDGLDEVRDEVVPALELHVDLRPAFSMRFRRVHQAVVGEDQVQAEHHQDDQEDDDHDHGPDRTGEGEAPRGTPYSRPVVRAPSSSCRPSASPTVERGRWPRRTRSRRSCLALRLGDPGLESDAWVTADGIVVLDHDGVVGGRLRRRPIASLPHAQLPATSRPSTTCTPRVAPASSCPST